MLTRISLKNFKAHADTAIDAAPLTVFIGPNNSGKSSIFQALLLWRQAAMRNSAKLCVQSKKQEISPGHGLAFGPAEPAQESPYLFTEDQLIDIGGFDEVVRGGETDIELGVSGDLRPKIPPRSHVLLPWAADLTVLTRKNALVHHEGRIKYAILPEPPSQAIRQASPYPGGGPKKQLNWSWDQGGQSQARITFPFPGPGGHDAELLFAPCAHFALLESGGYRFPTALSSEMQALLNEDSQRFADSACSLLRSLHVVYPLRGFEEVAYPLPTAPARTLDRMAVADRTTALLSILAYDRDKERQLSDWLERLMGLRVEAKLIPGQETRVTIRSYPAAGPRSELFSNQGTGTTQLPFILMPIGLTPPEETILLSEPEVHLHPKLQVHLMRLLIELWKREQRQFFIETHSEHVLHALLNAVAKGEISQSDLAIYYFENENGTARCRRLNVDERGGVEGGLPGFFDQSLDELSEYLQALKSK